ncbi:MAG TPA: hypothetical protein VMJ30_07695, partial [Gemmatimonadales bacterium]|nr:hypothetical protein [Gemmatimonadales bacterium]
PPKHKKPPAPWASNKGKAVNPKAPTGGGGAGTFKGAGPIKQNQDANRPLAHPDSPVGRNTAPIDSARDTSVPPPPTLDMGALMAAKAKELVGQRIISNPRNQNREECYDMVDEMLQQLGAKSAPEFMKHVGTDDDYVWGTPVDLDKIQPGDILQIRNSVLEYTVSIRYKALEKGQKAPDGVTRTTRMERGHHTAVVIALNKDGSFQVSEQHVLDESRTALSKTIRENTFMLHDIDGTPEVRNTTKDSVKVEETVIKSWKVKGGKVWAYRAQSK